VDDFVKTGMTSLMLKLGCPKRVWVLQRKEDSDSREFNTSQPIAGHWFLQPTAISAVSPDVLVGESIHHVRRMHNSRNWQ
jgi:hypothetical protein